MVVSSVVELIRRPVDAAEHEAIRALWKRHSIAEDERDLPTLISTLLGQCIRYDVGNVFDPAYTIVAKVEKALLERL